MTVRSDEACVHAPEYHAQVTPLAVRVSPTVFAVCGGRVFETAGSATRASPPAAGALPLGWYGGCIVVTAEPSGGGVLSFTYFGGPRSALAGESAASVSVTPSAFTAERRFLATLVTASAYTGVHAHTSQKWFRKSRRRRP
jgi:hypothetical protein